MRRPVRMMLAAVVAVLMLVVLAAMVSAVSAVGTFCPWGFGWDPDRAVRVQRPIRLDGAGSVVVRNPMGGVTVRGGGQAGEISVSGEIHVRGPNLDEQRARKLLSITREGDTLLIRVQARPWWRFPFPSFATADLVLVVPDGLALDVETGMGTVRLQDLSGHATVDTDMGEVEVRGFRGELAIKTDMGSITIADTSLSGRLALETNMGSIDFHGIPGPETVIHTDMGSVTLTIPGDRAYQLTLDTDLGRFESELPYTLRSPGDSGDHRHGVLGRGEVAGAMTISTSMGSVEIHEGVR